MVSFVFSANQKPFVICTRVTSFALVLQVCTRVTEELHSFLSQSELSNFFVYIIRYLSSFHLRTQGYKMQTCGTNFNSVILIYSALWTSISFDEAVSREKRLNERWVKIHRYGSFEKGKHKWITHNVHGGVKIYWVQLTSSSSVLHLFKK